MLGSSSTPIAADNTRRFVRIYALGSLLSGSNEDSLEKHRRYQDLLTMTLNQADLRGKVSPDLSFHRESRVLVVKATAAEHEIVGDLIKALKENENHPAPLGKP